MRNIEGENQISCLVNYGIVYSKRDMLRILRDLDYVEYVDLIDNLTVAKGEGYVVDVYSNGFDSTVIFHNRIHVNVNGFDFLKIRSEPEHLVELISGHRVIKLKPLPSHVLSSKSAIEEEIDEQRISIASQLACENEVELDYPYD